MRGVPRLAVVRPTAQVSSVLRRHASSSRCRDLNHTARGLPKYRESGFLLASPLFSVQNFSHGVVKVSSPPPRVCVCQQEHNVGPVNQVPYCAAGWYGTVAVYTDGLKNVLQCIGEICNHVVGMEVAYAPPKRQ